MEIYKIESGDFKLDGGATFGVVPKKMWEKTYPADENNLCLFALRNLLIRVDGRLILIDTGIGNKQEEKFYKHYHRTGHHSIEKAINDIGFAADQITDVILTHLHFDHVGDAVKCNKNGTLAPTFTNAVYHVSERQWKWATQPNQREKASYLPDNFMPLQEAGVLNLISNEDTELLTGIQLKMFHGHTDGLLVPFINYKDKTFVYTSDSLAMAAHIQTSWVCGYDTRPLISFEERSTFLQEACSKGYYLIFQHDYYTECCTLKQTEKGIIMGEAYKLEDLL